MPPKRKSAGVAAKQPVAAKSPRIQPTITTFLQPLKVTQQRAAVERNRVAQEEQRSLRMQEMSCVCGGSPGKVVTPTAALRKRKRDDDASDEPSGLDSFADITLVGDTPGACDLDLSPGLALSKSARSVGRTERRASLDVYKDILQATEEKLRPSFPGVNLSKSKALNGSKESQIVVGKDTNNDDTARAIRSEPWEDLKKAWEGQNLKSAPEPSRVQEEYQQSLGSFGFTRGKPKTSSRGARRRTFERPFEEEDDVDIDMNGDVTLVGSSQTPPLAFLATPPSSGVPSSQTPPSLSAIRTVPIGTAVLPSSRSPSPSAVALAHTPGSLLIPSSQSQDYSPLSLPSRLHFDVVPSSQTQEYTPLSPPPALKSLRHGVLGQDGDEDKDVVPSSQPEEVGYGFLQADDHPPSSLPAPPKALLDPESPDERVLASLKAAATSPSPLRSVDESPNAIVADNLSQAQETASSLFYNESVPFTAPPSLPGTETLDYIVENSGWSSGSMSLASFPKTRRVFQVIEDGACDTANRLEALRDLQPAALPTNINPDGDVLIGSLDRAAGDCDPGVEVLSSQAAETFVLVPASPTPYYTQSVPYTSPPALPTESMGMTELASFYSEMGEELADLRVERR